MVAHLLDELHLLIQEVAFQEVAEMRVCAGRTQGMQIQECLVQVLLQGQGSFHGLLGFTPFILSWLLHILKECTTPTIILQLEQTLGPLALLLDQFAEEVTYALQSRVIPTKKEAHREIGVGGPQVQVDQAVHGSFHFSGIILTNLRGHG
ncbi:mCG1042745 [Mus musculus]|nr:mCG1042745 [Mus musculus]